MFETCQDAHAWSCHTVHEGHSTELASNSWPILHGAGVPRRYRPRGEMLRGRCTVEVFVVDDGSPIAAADVLDRTSLGLDVRAVRVQHAGQAQASNAGALLGTGDIVVFCDSDMVLNPWSLGQIARALTIDGRALCFGFRENADPGDPRIDPAAIGRGLHADDVLLLGDDNRLRFDVPGYPSSLFAATRQLQDLTGGRCALPPGHMTWSLPNMAFGCLLACRRADFLDIGGFDGRFVNWGYSDTELCARWIASGRPLLPVFTANALHVRHAPRDPRQWRLAGENRSAV